MNYFSKRLLLFSVPLLLVLLMFELYLRKTDTVYKRKADQLTKSADSVEVLVLGNSHAFYAVDPAEFDAYTFNLAQTNQSFYFDKRLTLAYLDKLVKLKYVLISLDFHSLYFSSQGVRDTWSYYANRIAYKGTPGTIKKISRFYGYTPSVSLSYLKKDFLRLLSGSCEKLPVDKEEQAEGFSEKSQGWNYFKGTEQGALQQSAFQARAQVFNDVVRNSAERIEILADMEEFIAILKSKKIEPVLITSPVMAELKDLLDEKIRRQNDADIAYLSNKYHVPFIDISDSDFDRSDFFNCDHLNYSGAVKFSRELNKRLMHLEKDKF